jgi:LysR family transcriptional regulator, transcriptional activator of nhaA
MVAQEGGITAASRRLRLAPSTVSAQIRELEEQLGSPLLQRHGRTVQLTELGQVTVRYADRIFSLGRELREVVRAEAARPVDLVVGVADAISKVVACQLLEPALIGDPPVRLIVREGRPDRLVAELVLDELDLVLCDAPVSLQGATNYLLGESEVSFFGVGEVARAARAGFPGSLHGAPLLLPLAGTPLRRSLDRWFASAGVTPTVVGEFEDGALLAAFGRRGAGIYAALAAEADAATEGGVELVGRVPSIRVPAYAVAAGPLFRHPAAERIVRAARPA